MSIEHDFHGLRLLIAHMTSSINSGFEQACTGHWNSHIFYPYCHCPLKYLSLMRVMPNRIKIKMSKYYKLPPHIAVHMCF